MANIYEVFFTNEPNGKEMILRLFLGIYDQENQKQGKPTTFKNGKYRTQTDIANAIKSASNQRHHPAQSTISKALEDLAGRTLRYKGQNYMLGKVDGYYILLDSADFINLAKDQLYRVEFLGEDRAFFNNASPNTPSTVFAFKVAEEDTERVARLFEIALGNTCFEVLCYGELLIIFLDANNDGFLANSAWLKNYFEIKNKRIRSSKRAR